MKRTSISKIVLPILAFLTFGMSAANSEQVKKLDFYGVANSGQISIKINGDEQTMEYLTPSRSNRYTILEYDLSIDPNTGNRLVTAVAVDQLFNTTHDVLLYSGNGFTDIRIGKKRVTFTHVRSFNIER